MFARAMISFSVLSLPLLAAAVALPGDGYNALCSSGSAQCCDSTHEVSATSDLGDTIDELLEELDITLDDIAGLIGINCIPILGGSDACSDNLKTPVCCTNTGYIDGAIASGCSLGFTL